MIRIYCCPDRHRSRSDGFLTRDIQVVSDVFPVMFDETGAVPMPLPQVDYNQDILLSGWDIGVGVTDLTQNISVLADVFPVMVDETAAVPMHLPMVVETGPQVDYDPDRVLSGRDIEVKVTDITQDIRVLPDVFPVMFDETATVPLFSPVDHRWILGGRPLRRWSPSLMR